MKLVIDTNFYKALIDENPNALEALENANTIYIPFVVYAELYYGFKHGSKFDVNFKTLNRFIENFSIQIIHGDTDVATKYADIFNDLLKKGKPIPTNDVWIAACCMSVGGILHTYDKHFNSVHQIQVKLLLP